MIHIRSNSQRKKSALGLFLGIGMLGLSACNMMDDYMLGKDNTLMPTPLTPIKSVWDLKKLYAVVISGKQSQGHYRLLPAVTSQRVYVATNDGTLAAISKSDGQLVWKKKVASGLTSGPVVHDSFMALGTSSAKLKIFKTADGEMVWERSLSADLLAPPLYTNNQWVSKTIDSRVVSFSTSGKQLWALDHGSPQLILKASSMPVKMGNLVISAFSDGKVDAVDPETGRLLWEHEMVYATGASDVERLVDIDADPLVSGSTFYIASFQGEMGAFSTKENNFIWRKSISTYQNMAMNQTALFVVDRDGIIWSINRATGHVLWKQKAFKARGLTAPVLMGNHLFVADKSGFVHGLSAQTGEIKARADLGQPIEAAPVVDGNRLYISTLAGQLICLSVH